MTPLMKYTNLLRGAIQGMICMYLLSNIYFCQIKFRDKEIAEARIMYNQSEAIKLKEISNRRAAADENINRITEELQIRAKSDETDWQLKASKWLLFNKRKVEVKKREDEEAKVSKARRKDSLAAAANI